MRGDVEYLKEILDAAARVAAYIEGETVESFLGNLMLQDAVTYRLAVVGEASGRSTKPLRETRPDVPWRRVVAMRNILVHDYGGVDMNLTWITATVHAPALVEVVRQMLQGLEGGGGGGDRQVPAAPDPSPGPPSPQ